MVDFTRALHRTMREEFYAIAFRKKPYPLMGRIAARLRWKNESLQPWASAQRKILLRKNANADF